MLRRLPTVSPRRFEQMALVALAMNVLIVLTGAAVRLTGSGLGCTNWPRCTSGSFIAPLDAHAWIEFGNRLVTGLVAVPCLLVLAFALRRRPFRRDLVRLSALLPLGVLAQAGLGGATVLLELDAEVVMAHFLLSMALLAAAVAVVWRARFEPDARPAPEDRRVTLAARALVPLGALVVLAGTFATAAGPHAGGVGTGDVVPRLELLGADTLDTLIHWHGRSGTLLGLASLATWWFARRRGASAHLVRALTVLCLLVAAQGVVGFAQYELKLPSELVWVHVVLATATWTAVLFVAAAAGRLAPAVSREPAASPSALGSAPR